MTVGEIKGGTKHNIIPERAVLRGSLRTYDNDLRAQILERLHARREVIGDFDLTACFRFAGLPIDDAERSMRTFAREVLPTLHAR